MAEPVRDSGERMYRVFSEFIENPKLSEISITRSGKVRLISPTLRDTLLERLFGNQDLDPKTTLQVLHAVWLHYKTGGKELGLTNEKVRYVAQGLIDELAPSAPRLEGPKGEDLLAAIQGSIINYVKKHRLPRQVLVAQEAMMRWLLPLKELNLEEDLPQLSHHLVICGTAAKEKFRDLPPLPTGENDRFTSEQLAEVLEIVAHNMEETVDLSTYKNGKDLTDPSELEGVLREKIHDNSKTARLLKALSSTLGETPEENIREVLEGAVDMEKYPLKYERQSIWVIIGLKKIEVRHLLRFETKDENLEPSQRFLFDCEFCLSFDRELRECRDVTLKVTAPQFGLDVPDNFACEVNEALADHFPFSY